MSQTHSSEIPVASPTSCSVCRKITLRRPHQVSNVEINRDEVERATEALVGMPCVRIEKWIEHSINLTERKFMVHPNLILFDVTLLEMKAEEDATLKCNFCSNFGPLEHARHRSTASYLGACTDNGAWTFGFGSILTGEEGDSPKICFDLMGFQGQKFLTIADQGEVLFILDSEKILT